MIKQLFILLFAATTLMCCGSKVTSSSPPVDIEVPDVFYGEIPTEMSFAGERVPLEYPDVRQALQYELSVTMFMHSRTLLTLRAMPRYFAIIEPILKEHDIPEDFLYLAIAESSLNPEAISSAGAAGLWQFMKGTAKQYGMETGDNVDLRFNVEIATEAAARYLKDSYNIYKNWTLAAASYNVGTAGLSKRLEGQGVDSYYDVYLPTETMRYVYRILALKLVTQNPEKYGFHLTENDYQQPFKNYKMVTVDTTNIVWSEFAKKHNTNYKTLRMLNPWIRSYEYENKSKRSYEVKVPEKAFRINGQ